MAARAVAAAFYRSQKPIVNPSPAIPAEGGLLQKITSILKRVFSIAEQNGQGARDNVPKVRRFLPHQARISQFH